MPCNPAAVEAAPRHLVHPRSTLALAPCQSPCMLWKGPWTFVRQGILLTPTRERGGFTSPVLSVCWLGCMPQKQNVCFLIARVLEGPFPLASTPSVLGQVICPLGAWCRNHVCHSVDWGRGAPFRGLAGLWATKAHSCPPQPGELRAAQTHKPSQAGLTRWVLLVPPGCTEHLL